MRWTVETLNETVDAEVETLPEDMRTRLARIAKLIEEIGLEHVGEPHVKHIEGRLWEMRLKGSQRNFACAVCDRCRSAGRDRQGIRQEDGEDAAPRNRSSLDAR